jgi:murein DD-endopeptidase MepM/ murein hydrolase activator NlpD
VTRPNLPGSTRDARRLAPSRARLLSCSLAVAVGTGGAAVAVAQTPPELSADAATSIPADAAMAPEAGGDTGTAMTGEASQPAQSGSGGQGNARADKPPRLVKENADPEKVISGRKKALFKFETGGRAGDLKVKAMKKGNGKIAKSWSRPGVEPGDKQSVTWGAKNASGRYFFRVETADGEGLARKHAKGDREVRVSDGMFPVRGKHQYWDGFGAGRSHDGQDVGAKCGTPLVAAQAGKVVYRGKDGGGYGNYLVINLAGQKNAEVYAHLKRTAKVKKGDKVEIGESIGRVGETGNAFGCHLHFEYWKGRWPGGKASKTVTKHLKEWDKAS